MRGGASEEQVQLSVKNDNLISYDKSIENTRRLCIDGNELATVEELKKVMEYIEEIKINTIPVGVIIPFSGNGTPNGRWLLCDGRIVKREDYQDLYNVIGRTYGGNAEVFLLPDLIDRFIEGTNENVSYVRAGLPNITGTTAGDNFADGVVGGAFYLNGESQKISGSGHGWGKIHYFDASRSSKIYGRSDTVQPDSLKLKYYIKY